MFDSIWFEMNIANIEFIALKNPHYNTGWHKKLISIISNAFLSCKLLIYYFIFWGFGSLNFSKMKQYFISSNDMEI